MDRLTRVKDLHICYRTLDGLSLDLYSSGICINNSIVWFRRTGKQITPNLWYPPIDHYGAPESAHYTLWANRRKLIAIRSKVPRRENARISSARVVSSHGPMFYLSKTSPLIDTLCEISAIYRDGTLTDKSKSVAFLGPRLQTRKGAATELLCLGSANERRVLTLEMGKFGGVVIGGPADVTTRLTEKSVG
ncbi:hypothetical protein TcasGA2_TC005639 [Tribolium castaneum]|uniref:Uncharacterized protein n=1 Tax=Tribolium castaneum TaxID=7070 RepID=D6WX45_TRICA|nr:hypothetical protein TcasGA2_TC005639 [Tribolium castaneum]